MTDNNDEEITIILDKHESLRVSVNKAEFEAAREDDELDMFLDVYVSDMDVDYTTVTLPDGEEIELY